MCTSDKCANRMQHILIYDDLCLKTKNAQKKSKILEFFLETNRNNTSKLSAHTNRSGSFSRPTHFRGHAQKFQFLKLKKILKFTRPFFTRGLYDCFDTFVLKISTGEWICIVKCCRTILESVHGANIYLRE